MLIHDFKVADTPSSGDASGNTGTLSHGEFRQIIVLPTTNTTEYRFILTDRNSVIVFDESTRGNMRRQVTIPRVGIVTWAISVATVDEEFTILLKSQEI